METHSKIGTDAISKLTRNCVRNLFCPPSVFRYKSRIVELEDGSLWRIWPGDLALTLNWLPTTDLRVSEISDELCSHALIDPADGPRVRVIKASKDWPVEQVRRLMKKR